MSLLKTIQPGEATGDVKSVYIEMTERTGQVPKPVELASVSPFFFQTLMKTIAYYSSHPNLNFPLLVLIRMLSSKSCSNTICFNFNRQVLKNQGLNDAEIDKILKDPKAAELSEKDEAILLFVLKAVNDPDIVDQNDINRLHGLGWSDADIYDAVTTGVNMFALNKMMRIFKM